MKSNGSYRGRPDFLIERIRRPQQNLGEVFVTSALSPTAVHWNELPVV